MHRDNEYDGQEPATRDASHLIIGMEQPATRSDESAQSFAFNVASTMVRESNEPGKQFLPSNGTSIRNRTKRRTARRPTKELKGQISLTRILLDSYEYKSFNELGLFMLFFLVATLFLFFQWGKQSAGFKNSVIQSFVSFDSGNDYEYQNLNGIDTIEDGWDYLMGYMQTHINRTDALAIPGMPSEVWVNEFAQIGYARIFINFNQNCRAKRGRNDKRAFPDDQIPKKEGRRLECIFDNPTDPDVQAFMGLTLNKTEYKRSNKIPRKNVTEWFNQKLADRGHYVNATHMDGYASPPKGVWVELERRPGWATTIITRNDTAGLLHNRQDFQEYLVQLADASNTPDGFMRRVVGKYAYQIQLAMVASSRLGTDAAVFRLNIRLADANQRLVSEMGTGSVNTGRDNRNAPLVWVCHALFCFFTLYYFRQQLQHWRIAFLEHGFMAEYLMHFWNIWEILSLIANTAWIIWFWCVLGQDPKTFPRNVREHEWLDRRADLYTSWLYFGIIILNLMGVTMCRFMRIHLGLRAYYQMFHDAFKHVVDFAVFVLYLILVLGIATFAFFQISGGNALFVTYSNGLNALARVGFNIIEYNEFKADAAGVTTRWKWTVSMMFWLSVILLTVFVQNTLIAIISYAYERAREKTAQVEVSFIALIMFRICFLCRYLAANFLLECFTYNKSSKDGAAPNLFMHPKYKLPCSIIAKYRRKAKDPENMVGFTAQAARFSCARLREVQALCNMCTDWATLKLAHDGDPGWRRLVGSGREVDPESFQGHTMVMPDLGEDGIQKTFDLKVDAAELSALLRKVREKHEKWAPKTWLGRAFFGKGPLRGVREEAIAPVVKVLLEVYENVESPTIDEDGDGVDDEQAAAVVSQLKKEVIDLKSKHEEQTRLIAELIEAIRGHGAFPASQQ